MNEFLPLISGDVVAVMRENNAAEGTTTAAAAGRKRRRLSPSSFPDGADVDFERWIS